MNHLQKLIAVLTLGLVLAGCDMTLTGMEGSKIGDVSLYWSPPLERVNGERLTPDDIKGFEIRYRHQSDTRYQRVFLDSNNIDSYHFDDLRDPDGYVFQIAVVDDKGIYSDFVTAHR